MRFRNYFPRDDDLQKAKHPPPVIPKFEDPVATDPLQVAGSEVILDFAILVYFVLVRGCSRSSVMI